MIQLRIKEILIQKGIKPTAFSLAALGIPRRSAQQMLNGKAKSISLEYLERLCIGLRCTPKEILGVYSTEDQPIPPDAPLYGWVGYAILQPMEQLRELSPEQIEKASALLKELIDRG
jgi:DNA-binding Xre family transcriptional regulator